MMKLVIERMSEFKAFPKTQLGGPSLFRQFRDEKTEEQAEEDQTEQLSFHGRLEKIGRYHAMKDFEDAGPPFVRLVQGPSIFDE